MKRLLVAILCFQMMGLPLTRQVRAEIKPAPAGFESNTTLRLIRNEIATNPAFYYAEENLSAQGAVENKGLALSGLQEILARCLDTSVTIESIREQLAHQAVAEEEAQMIEIRFILQRMPSETIDRIFSDAFRRGTYDPSLRQQFENAYKASEKRQVLAAMAQSDLLQVKSLTLKRLGLLDREALVRELSLMQSLLNTKGRDTWKVVLVVVLSVAAAGFVSWAAISQTKKAWEKRTRQAEEDEQRREEQAAQDYANRELELQKIFDDRAKLREEGYVWSVCSTETKTTTAACSYDYLTHSGSTLCTTYCMKNFATGDKKFPQTTCSSAFVPSNCSLPNPYDSGYNNGHYWGHDDGYNDGYDRAYNDAYDDFYRQGYDDGYLKGYDFGYNEGYYDGWAQAEYEDTPIEIPPEDDFPVDDTPVDDSDDDDYWDYSFKPMAAAAQDSVALGFKSGYREGYAMATTLRIGQ